MKKKVGIVTIIDNNNYGNRLQNYAVQTVLNRMNIENETIKNTAVFNEKKHFLLRKIKYFMRDSYNTYSDNLERKHAFEKFNENITFSKKKYTIYSKYKYDCMIVGSDQVWNPNFGRMRDVDLLNVNCKNKCINKIAFSASFGINKLPDSIDKKKILGCFNDFSKISVREDYGKKILENLGYKNKLSVLVDPTMLLSADEWNKVSSRPKGLKNDKYILNYFLGSLSKKRKNEINKVAKNNNCEVIDIMDKSSVFYTCGPGEFIYLVRNAFLICTDSFHASVFSIIYNRPFIIFDREQANLTSMNSRIDTLISKFKLKDRKYNEICITHENINHDYSNAYSILREERKKAELFLDKALEEV